MADAGDNSQLAPAAACGADSQDLVVRVDARGIILYVSDSCRSFG